jgi:hypothetical protein
MHKANQLTKQDKTIHVTHKKSTSLNGGFYAFRGLSPTSKQSIKKKKKKQVST